MTRKPGKTALTFLIIALIAAISFLTLGKTGTFWPLVVTGQATALYLWIQGRRWNRPGASHEGPPVGRDAGEPRRTYTFFFIDWEYWGVVLAVLVTASLTARHPLVALVSGLFWSGWFLSSWIGRSPRADRPLRTRRGRVDFRDAARPRSGIPIRLLKEFFRS